MHEALFYTKEHDAAVQCRLCPHMCRIAEGKTGRCGVRKNQNGILYSLVYGRVAAEHVDPVEKKPVFHVLPGSMSYSLSTVGCNMQCRHCQNFELSQMPHEKGFIYGDSKSPQHIVDDALRHGCDSISFTYTEPTVYFEFAADIAQQARTQGLKTIFVSNGYVNREPLEYISPYLDAANIDLKAFSDDFYRTVCHARLEPVLESIRLYKTLGIWLEVTTLIIPGYNDAAADLQKTASFIASVGVDIPWHVSAFYPTYLLTDCDRTSPEKLAEARSIGLSCGLRYVYTGNIPGDGGEHTFCPNCNKSLVQRYGFQVIGNALEEGACPACGQHIDGVFA